MNFHFYKEYEYCFRENLNLVCVSSKKKAGEKAEPEEVPINVIIPLPSPLLPQKNKKKRLN